MDDIVKGSHIEVIDALGRRFSKRALSPIQRTGRFPAVWACSEDEWSEAERQGREAEAEPFPWPLASVRLVDHVVA